MLLQLPALQSALKAEKRDGSGEKTPAVAQFSHRSLPPSPVLSWLPAGQICTFAGHAAGLDTVLPHLEKPVALQAVLRAAQAHANAGHAAIIGVILHYPIHVVQWKCADVSHMASISAILVLYWGGAVGKAALRRRVTFEGLPWVQKS